MGKSDKVSQEMVIEDRLVPVLREAVNIVKMIFFKKLKPYIEEKYPSDIPGFANRLSGAIINDLFGTPSNEEPFKTFTLDNRSVIEEELGCVAEAFEDLRIPLTDALRVQFLCDDREGIDNQASLSQARDLGIMIIDREVPLPKTFMSQVRRLGVAFGLLSPQEITEDTD